MDRFCVLPGQPEARIAKTDGRVILIGEEPRTIPEDLHQEARAAGAITEADLKKLKARLSGEKEEKKDPEKKPEDKKPEGGKEGEGDQGDNPDAERAEKIRQATIAVLNAGNPEDLTSSKKPKVEVLEAQSGIAEITAAERDAAFDQVKG